ncbi:Hypothetical protein D9617_31g064180 [Elsinoe fawcettii]|nr:Hypothetical protein D9617_31g064180 [Elsinoe fawcettii]
MHGRRLLIIYGLLASWYVLRVSAILVAGAVVIGNIQDHLPQVIRRAEEAMATPDRAIYTAISHTCTMILGGVFGSRICHLSTSSLRRVTFINSIILALYFMSAAFLLSAALIQTGFNVNEVGSCNAAVYSCVVFYFMSKGFIQLFLIERAHAIRAHKLSRCQDRVYLSFVVAIVFGFGSIMVAAIVWPIAEVSDIDGFCRIGLLVPIAASIIAADLVINAALTGVFIWLLRPLQRRRRATRHDNGIMIQRRVSFSSSAPSPDTDPEIHSATYDTIGPSVTLRPQVTALSDQESLKGTGSANITNIVERQPTCGTDLHAYHPKDVIVSRNANWIDKLIVKSTIGTVLVIFPTIANLGFLSHQGGRERAWICLTFCTVDVTWAVLILHWLTVGSPEPTPPIPRSSVGVA